MPGGWHRLGSLFKTGNRADDHTAGVLPLHARAPSVIQVAALIVNEDDRNVVSRIASRPEEADAELWQVHFAESREEVLSVAARLSAPVILVDRDWPGMEWKGTVASLAALPHHACVILASGVVDTYLWQEVVRQDGYDILAKPLRIENVLRVVKLALSYRSIRTQQPNAVAGGK